MASRYPTLAPALCMACLQRLPQGLPLREGQGLLRAIMGLSTHQPSSQDQANTASPLKCTGPQAPHCPQHHAQSCHRRLLSPLAQPTFAPASAASIASQPTGRPISTARIPSGCCTLRACTAACTCHTLPDTGCLGRLRCTPHQP